MSGTSLTLNFELSRKKLNNDKIKKQHKRELKKSEIDDFFRYNFHWIIIFELTRCG